MLDKDKLSVVSDFFLDAAKIIFASLVVGVFAPGALDKIPWLTFLTGIVITILFLTVSVKLSVRGDK